MKQAVILETSDVRDLQRGRMLEITLDGTSIMLGMKRTPTKIHRRMAKARAARYKKKKEAK